MWNLSNERFLSKLDHRITEIENKALCLVDLLLDLEASRLDTCVTLEMLAMTTEHLSILRESRETLQAMQDQR